MSNGTPPGSGRPPVIGQPGGGPRPTQPSPAAPGAPAAPAAPAPPPAAAPALDELYDLVYDAVRQAIADDGSGGDPKLSKRLVGGAVLFRDSEGRTVKEVDAFVLFRKVTSIRDKLRVLEQRINASEALPHDERAELQGYITKCYGSLTTFNFLFREEEDKFKGTGD